LEVLESLGREDEVVFPPEEVAVVGVMRAALSRMALSEVK
jgi:hypothetical protein